MSLFEAIPTALHGLFYGAPATMGAAATTGGILTGGLQSMAESMMGLTMGKSIYDWAFGGANQGMTPGKVGPGAIPQANRVSTISAGPSTPSPNYGSMASAMSAPTMADLTRLEEIGGAIPPPGVTMPVPPQPPGPGQVPPIEPNPMAAALGSGADAYLKLRQVAAQEAQAQKPFSHQPTIRPGSPVPISVGKPLAVKSPLERYAMMLRRF